MQVGDLVTLSSYSKKSSGLSAWNDRLYPNKPQLVGLVVRIEENPHIRRWTSKNESTYYYINWINKDCPVSRWGSATYYRKNAYFLRNDLKFLKKG